VDARVREEIDVPDPATGELLGRSPISGPEDVDRAVRAAQEAYEEWNLEPRKSRAVEQVVRANNGRRIVA
jgi:acyl-CoA reductase-like NAD-dependent aldehyde dehydrogenase